MPGWKCKNIVRVGRVSLAMHYIRFSHVDMAVPKWASAKVNRITHSFVWRGDDSETTGGGRLLVNWKMVCRPKALGRVGIADLKRFGRALRLR